MRGEKVSAGSKMLSENVASYTATVIDDWRIARSPSGKRGWMSSDGKSFAECWYSSRGNGEESNRREVESAARLRNHAAVANGTVVAIGAYTVEAFDYQPFQGLSGRNRVTGGVRGTV